MTAGSELNAGAAPLVIALGQEAAFSTTGAAAKQAELGASLAEGGGEIEAYLGTHQARRAWIKMVLQLRKVPRVHLTREEQRRACRDILQREASELLRMPAIY